MSDNGLRIQKKRATKKKIADVAFQLAVTHGVDGFIIEDVVKQAGYSRRTFANHFSCKEEAIAASLTLIEENRSDSPMLEDLTPLAAIEVAIKRRFSLDMLNHLHQLVTLSKDYPSLALYVHAAINELHIFARDSISEVYKHHHSKEYYYILIGAVFGALMPILEGHIPIQIPMDETETESSNEFNQYLEKTFAYLRKGFE